MRVLRYSHSSFSHFCCLHFQKCFKLGLVPRWRHGFKHFCRRSQPGVTPIFAKRERRSRTLKKTFAMDWSWCFCLRSSLANSCRSPIEERCASTSCPMSTRHCSSSKARECVSFQLVLKVSAGKNKCNSVKSSQSPFIGLNQIGSL